MWRCHWLKPLRYTWKQNKLIPVEERVIGEKSLILTQISRVLDIEEGKKGRIEAGGVDQVLLIHHPNPDQDLDKGLGLDRLQFH